MNYAVVFLYNHITIYVYDDRSERESKECHRQKGWDFRQHTRADKSAVVDSHDYTIVVHDNDPAIEISDPAERGLSL